MQTRNTHYYSRDEMVRAIRNMAAEGWMVEVITTLPENAYRVKFVERVGMRPASSFGTASAPDIQGAS